MGGKNRLWYDRPAETWEEALPVGNGFLGGMAFGDPVAERIALNEDSVWYGGPRDRNNPDAPGSLEAIRAALREGRLREAQALAVMALSGVPDTQRHYMPLGDLLLSFDHDGEITKYSRALVLDQGIATVAYRAGSRSFSREMFSSFPDRVLAIRCKAETAGSLNLTIRLARGDNRYMEETVRAGDRTLVMRGECGGAGGMAFRAALRAEVSGGETRIVGEHLTISGADAVTLLLTAATTFREEDPEGWCLSTLEAASAIGYARLRHRHLADFGPLMARFALRLGSLDEAAAHDLLTTDRRLSRVQEGARDDALIALYVQYGRYLLLSCSRPGSLPANLQGIWNDRMLPPWDSKYTININTQMNYWPAEPLALQECHRPLFDLLERMRAPGRHTARVMYGCKGFVAHHNTDIWADTAPQDMYLPATYWPMGAAWFCLHLWEHYAYGRDIEFLRNAYPVMREAAEFFEDFLVETADGKLATAPSVSPENTYLLPGGERGTLCIGPSMDNQILYELFSACMEACHLLSEDSAELVRWESLRDRLPEPAVGKEGQLLEWMEEYEETEPGHRHISHLFALHPGTRFTVRGTPEWSRAASVTLQRRLANGGGHTGWSRAWIVNFWARLEDGEQAYENIRALLAHSTLPNLLDNHPPFQIDGNFGGAAGVSEMLLQSHAGALHLLPALPSGWQEGEVNGLRARGGYTVRIKWAAGVLEEAQVLAAHGGRCRLRTAGVVRIEQEGRPVSCELNGDGTLEWTAEAGGTYRVLPVKSV
ncbi:glycoside hydrolase N-terminal domain-containing protein [Cohnella sp. GCM10020058]|uniref:glycoside hydrolase family 95 protein n=1 Tax=Cohnella sp. GCM10020058 TaxID=3317330 RepID=UPI003627ED54